MRLPPFVIPGKPFARSLAELRDELTVLLPGDRPFPLARVFDFVTLTDANQALQHALERRGNFVKTTGTTWCNSGRIINKVMHDVGQHLDRLRLYVPREIAFEFANEDEVITLDLRSTRILVIFFEPPAPGIGQRFVITTLRIEESRWSYIGINDDDRTQKIEVVVDLLVEPQRFRRPKSDFRGFERSKVLLQSRPKLLVSGANCTCCNSFQPAKPLPADGPRLVTLHAKVMFKPRIPIESQVNAMNTVFAAADIRVELASVEVLDLPEFLDVDIGRCFLGEVTDEQHRLFTTVRNGVGPNDVCAYWVRSIGYPTIGCAAHPRALPSLIMTRYGSQWVLAHEVGHVLGLLHVGSSDNLMFCADAVTNPPPDLTSDQVVTMRSSPWAPLEAQTLVAALQ